MVQKRSISDEEIALIKAMVGRKMKGKDIQFFFNRPDRSVNSGRISDIKTGRYSNSAFISPAKDNELEAFLKSFTSSDVSASISVSEAGVVMPLDDGPTGEHTLNSLFEIDPDNTWRFKHGESDQHECKENFGFKYSGKWLRAVAALSNNSGGYVVFGVKDKKISNGEVDPESYKVTGLSGNEFEHADPVQFTKLLKATFDPTPKIEVAILHIAEVKVGIIYVHQHGSRPVIALRGDGKEIKEGDIFFRYPGESSRIKYSDLRGILDDRDRQSREQILPMVEKLLQLGPQNAMVADLSSGVMSDEKRSIIVGEELLDKIKFIQEGTFDEKEGEPTLKLIGEVKPISTGKAVLHKSFATPTDLVRDFLEGKSPHDPKDYIRCVVEVGNGAWLPMHFYASQAGMDRKSLAEFISTTSATSHRKSTYIERAIGANGAYQKVGGDAVFWHSQIMEGTKPDIKDAGSAIEVARAINGLAEKPKLQLDDLLQTLTQCWDTIEEKKFNRLSSVRKAIARVDELFFAKD
jgi:hypothetical protein